MNNTGIEPIGCSYDQRMRFYSSDKFICTIFPMLTNSYFAA